MSRALPHPSWGSVCAHTGLDCREQGCGQGHWNRMAAERTLWTHCHSLERWPKEAVIPLQCPIISNPKAPKGNYYHTLGNQTRRAPGCLSSPSTGLWGGNMSFHLCCLCLEAGELGHPSPQSSVSMENKKNQRKYNLECWNEGNTRSLSPVTPTSLWDTSPNLWELAPLSRRLNM